MSVAWLPVLRRPATDLNSVGLTQTKVRLDLFATKVSQLFIPVQAKRLLRLKIAKKNRETVNLIVELTVLNHRVDPSEQIFAGSGKK